MFGVEVDVEVEVATSLRSCLRDDRRSTMDDDEMMDHDHDMERNSFFFLAFLFSILVLYV